MSKFITGKELEDAVYNIIWDAEKFLLIVSPYIKLDDYFKKLFDKHKDLPKVHILLVFGKNEKEVKRSMSKEDFDYFKKFPNISIIYVPNLHAKYYGNERKGVITSINLYDYSFINNIEFGVYTEESILNSLKQNNADKDAWNTCINIAENNEVVFIKRPVYETKKVIINLGRNYIKSEVLYDSTEKFYGVSKTIKTKEKRLLDFPDEIELGTSKGDRPVREEIESKSLKAEIEPQFNVNHRTIGYCIRTGKEIPFNIEKPMAYDAFKVWNQYKDTDYPEQYCHYSGEPSNGKTSVSKPILNKNWRKAKQEFNL